MKRDRKWTESSDFERLKIIVGRIDIYIYIHIIIYVYKYTYTHIYYTSIPFDID